MLENRFKFNHFYYYECTDCGYRENASINPQTKPPSGNDIFINSKEGNCPGCKKYHMVWDVICVTKKEEILPRM